ncbi:hypothetical protein ACYPKM_00695 [Pseudomonas aeruginosa]
MQISKEQAKGLLALLECIDIDGDREFIDEVCTVREQLPADTEEKLRQIVNSAE